MIQSNVVMLQGKKGGGGVTQGSSDEMLDAHG